MLKTVTSVPNSAFDFQFFMEVKVGVISIRKRGIIICFVVGVVYT
jgi:hypothetical protein